VMPDQVRAGIAGLHDTAPRSSTEGVPGCSASDLLTGTGPFPVLLAAPVSHCGIRLADSLPRPGGRGQVTLIVPERETVNPVRPPRAGCGEGLAVPWTSDQDSVSCRSASCG
jgi:hypothetical protein